jgi:hypothetical protein
LTADGSTGYEEKATASRAPAFEISFPQATTWSMFASLPFLAPGRVLPALLLTAAAITFVCSSIFVSEVATSSAESEDPLVEMVAAALLAALPSTLSEESAVSLEADFAFAFAFFFFFFFFFFACDHVHEVR